MSTHHSFDKICVAILLCTLLITGLFMNGSRLGIQAVADEDAEANSDSAWFTANDLDGSWSTDGATRIVLSGDSATVSGQGAYAYDGDVVIANGGWYVIEGSLSDGSIIISAYSSSKVWILLNGVDITCEEDACIQVDQADKVFLTLAEGTENVLTGGSTFSEEAAADGTGGTIYAHDDLTINGSGSLVISGSCEHGIEANDDLVITGGTIIIEAEKDAVHVNDSFRVAGAGITVTAGDDGIAVTSTENGYFYMESGVLSVTSEDDGIHAAGAVTIAGGELNISAGDDGIHSDTSVLIQDGIVSIPKCYEGVEAPIIEMEGGDVDIRPSDDGMNANGGTSQMAGGGFGGGQMNGGFGGGQTEGGQLTAEEEPSSEESTSSAREEPSSGEGTSPAEETLPLEEDGAAGMPDAPSGQGFPGRNEEAADGETHADGEFPADGERPSDRSFPAAGETFPDGGSPGGENAESQDTSVETYIRISGGNLTIINETGRDADGLDSNGDIFITGGNILVSLINSGSNNAIDVASENGGVAEISGGTLVAAGSYSMAESFDSSSEQASLLYTDASGVEAGTTISIEDTEGNVLLSREIPLSFSAVTISSPQMQVGETYLVCVGDEAEEITLSEVSASYGDGQSTMFGGTMNWGQRSSREDRMGGGQMSGGQNGGGRMGGGRMEMDRRPGDSGSTGAGREMEDTTEPGEMPEGMSMPEPGEMPEGMSMPEPGEMPEGMSMPEFGESPDGMSQPEREGGRGAGNSAQTQNTSEQEETAAAALETRSELTPEQWFWTGISAVILIAGLVFTRFFRRR